MLTKEEFLREDTELKAVHQLLLSAKTARELSDKGHKLKCEKEFNDIMKTIKNSAANGYYYCTIDGYISEENKKRLKKLGYEVSLNRFDSDLSMWTQIQW